MNQVEQGEGEGGGGGGGGGGVVDVDEVIQQLESTKQVNSILIKQ